MNGFFGQCGCGCRGFSTFESQQVFAGVLYPLGTLGIQALSAPGWGGTVAINPLKIPAQVYLGSGEEFINPDGTVVYRSATILNPYDGIGDDDGSFDRRAELSWVGLSSVTLVSKTNPDANSILATFDNGAQIRYFVNTPYTYAQAVANAVTLLAAVSLLNLTKTYSGNFYQNSFNYPFSGVHFCYPSEVASSGWSTLNFFNRETGHAATSTLYVTWQVDRPSGGGPMTSHEPLISSDPNINGYPGGATISPPYAYNGIALHAAQEDGSPFAAYNGWIWASKMAVRSPYPFRQRDDVLWDSGTEDFTIKHALNLNPAIPSGENIFLPSDVPGYGQSRWFKEAIIQFNQNSQFNQNYKF